MVSPKLTTNVSMLYIIIICYIYNDLLLGWIIHPVKVVTIQLFNKKIII